ncbi:MAG: hypothetical protein AB7U20_21980 [Planctomycetaceae bacterium]
MQVIIVGPVESAPYTEIVETVQRSVSAEDVRAVGDLAEISRTPPADLIVVLQQWPDEYTPAEVQDLIDSAPLARLLVCYGPWCDSDGRTRDVWPLGIRVPIAAAPARLILEIAKLRGECPPLPLTADRNETYLHAQTVGRKLHVRSLRIAVVSADRALSEALHDVLTSAGHTVVAPLLPGGSHSTTADLLLWDADPWDDAAGTSLHTLREDHPDVPVAALCGFPRPHLESELRAAGVCAVIPKCADVELLATALNVLPGATR